MKVTFAELKDLGSGNTDVARVQSMTDEEAEANALADPDSFVTTESSIRTSRAKIIRRAFGLTQEEFAARFHIPLGTLRDWEQHRTEPDQAAQAYLKVIAKEPDMVARALAEHKQAAAE